MPIYTYQCSECGYQFDDLEPMIGGLMEKPCRAPIGADDSLTMEENEDRLCQGTARRVPSIPAPARFNCSMPTYQKGDK